MLRWPHVRSWVIKMTFEIEPTNDSGHLQFRRTDPLPVRLDFPKDWFIILIISDDGDEVRKVLLARSDSEARTELKTYLHEEGWYDSSDESEAEVLAKIDAARTFTTLFAEAKHFQLGENDTQIVRVLHLNNAGLIINQW